MIWHLVAVFFGVPMLYVGAVGYWEYREDFWMSLMTFAFMGQGAALLYYALRLQ